MGWFLAEFVLSTNKSDAKIPMYLASFFRFSWEKATRLMKVGKNTKNESAAEPGPRRPCLIVEHPIRAAECLLWYYFTLGCFQAG